MRIDERQLQNISEPTLLRWVIEMYQSSNTHLKAIEVIADVAMVSPSSIRNYISEGSKGSIGPQAWARVWNYTKNELIPAWHKVHVKFEGWDGNISGRDDSSGAVAVNASSGKSGRGREGHTQRVDRKRSRDTAGVRREESASSHPVLRAATSPRTQGQVGGK